MLELAEEFTLLLESRIKGVDEKLAEDFGILLARNKEKIVSACKGSPEVLRDLETEDDTTVTPIANAG